MNSNFQAPLTQEKFLSAVLNSNIRTAVFDFDGTLWPGDAGSGFMQWSINAGLLSPSAANHLTQRHEAYQRGEIGEIAICGEMTQIYDDLPEDSVRAGAAEYFRTFVRSNFFPSMLSAVTGLQQQAAEIWAVSSTNAWMIEEGVRELGIPANRVLAASVVVLDGKITQQLIRVPSDEGKAGALQLVGLHCPDAVFGNSVHDIHMLQMARLPFAINPSLALAEYSQRQAWPTYYPVLSQEES